MAADARDLGTVALELADAVPDALLRMVTVAARESPEAVARSLRVIKLAASGVPETDPEYVAAMDDLERFAVLTVQRSDLQTRAEVRAMAARVLRALPRVIAAIVAAV